MGFFARLHGIVGESRKWVSSNSKLRMANPAPSPPSRFFSIQAGSFVSGNKYPYMPIAFIAWELLNAPVNPKKWPKNGPLAAAGFSRVLNSDS